MLSSLWFAVAATMGFIAMRISVHRASSYAIPVFAVLLVGLYMLQDHYLGRSGFASVGATIAGAFVGLVGGAIWEARFGMTRQWVGALQAGNLDRAERIAEEMIELRGDVESHSCLGKTHLVAERWPEALAQFQKADAMARADAAPSGVDDVADVFDDTDRLGPVGAELRMNLAMATWKCGDPKQAVAMARSAATALPDDLTVQLNCAGIELQAGELEDARARLETIQPKIATARPAAARDGWKAQWDEIDAELQRRSA